MSGRQLPPKKEVALALLENGSVFVHLDPRLPAVRVPPWFTRQPQLVLQFGLNMAVAIPDLDVSDSGISGTLSFNRTPTYCFVPWSAVFALVGDDQRGLIWPDDMPRELAARAAEAAKPPAAEAPARPRLRAVPSPASAPDASQVAAKKPRRRKAASETASAETPVGALAATDAKTAKKPSRRKAASAVAAPSTEAPAADEAKTPRRRRAAPKAAPPLAKKLELVPSERPAAGRPRVVRVPAQAPAPKQPAARAKAAAAPAPVTPAAGSASARGAGRERPRPTLAAVPPAKPPSAPKGGSPKREFPSYLRLIK